MPAHNECPFCFRIYGEAEEHDCEERKAWEKTFIGQATEARKALDNFVKVLIEESKEAYKILEEKVWNTDGKSVRSKDDN